MSSQATCDCRRLVYVMHDFVCRSTPIPAVLSTTVTDLSGRCYARVMWLNAHSLAVPRPQYIKDEMVNRSIDFTLLGETWHSYRTDPRITSCVPQSFTLKERARGSIGGGLCTIYREELIASRMYANAYMTLFQN